MSFPLDASLAHIDELSELLKSRKKAESLLQKLGIRLMNDLFSRQLLIQALEAPNEQVTEDKPTASLRVLRDRLAAYALDVRNPRAGKTISVELFAPDTTRVIEKAVEDGQNIVLKPGEAVDARVHYATAVRSGAAQFTVSGFDREDAPSVYFFVLLSEPHVWMACPAELAQIERELVNDAEQGIKRSRMKTMGYALHAGRRGYLSVWLSPKHSGSALHLQERIADEHGALVYKQAGIAY